MGPTLLHAGAEFSFLSAVNAWTQPLYLITDTSEIRSKSMRERVCRDLNESENWMRTKNWMTVRIG